jgi:hypothetical protein
LSQIQDWVTHGGSKTIAHHCLCTSRTFDHSGRGSGWQLSSSARQHCGASPPGSGTDLLARLLADQLSKRWSKAIIVENGSGVASGNVAAADLARSSPDDYTLRAARCENPYCVATP